MGRVLSASFAKSLWPRVFQLLTVIPVENSLALIYRDKETLRFVKHINHRATESAYATEFVDFAFTYYE